jgi:DnaK suppressor protein
MHYLTIEQRESLGAALKERGEALRDNIARILGGGARPRALADHREETDDDAVIDLESSLEVDSLQRNSMELREVEKAKARLHTLEYGECSDCGGDIPFTRLQANPLATRCTTCQAAFERTHPSPAPQL